MKQHHKTHVLRQALKTGDLERLKKAVCRKPVVCFWEEISPGVYQNERTGEIKPYTAFERKKEYDSFLFFDTVNILHDAFFPDGSRIYSR